MTAAILLNYNDADTTIAAARRAASVCCIDRVVIVDNASPDGSAERIAAALDLAPLQGTGENRETVVFAGKEAAAERASGTPAGVILLQAPKNGGYGYGNNLGVRWAARELGADLALIANPDAAFGEELVQEMQQLFQDEPDTGAAGAMMQELQQDGMPAAKGTGAAGGSYDAHIRAGWCRRGFWGELLHSGPVCKRLFRRRLNYPPSYYKKKCPEVYAVHGSLLMVSTDAFLQCGGYDEEMFLYMEEYALGARMQSIGRKTRLLETGYLHEGSHSISGSGLKALQRQRLRQASERIYYRKYLHAGPVAMAAAKVFQAAVLLETRLFLRA